jgi:leucine dehydrogenase
MAPLLSEHDGTEQVTRCVDRTSGLRAVIAVDDTTLGPGLGGVRWMAYPDMEAAEVEARRLARIMTLKHACADLPYGGAKSVILRDPDMAGTGSDPHRTAQLLAFGRYVDLLGGTYVPGVDIGTSVADLALIGTVAHQVACDHEDPSPSTALGVFAGISAALSAIGRRLEGAHVVVQGAGHVGSELVRHLVEAGCRVSVADADPDRAQAVARAAGGSVVAPVAAVTAPCDVLAPCATARVVDGANVDQLQCRILAGAANDVLANRQLADRLARRNIVYVPDFVINAGGVVHIHALGSSWGTDKLEGSLLAIGDRVARILGDAARRDRTPLSVAEELASERLGRPIALPG